MKLLNKNKDSVNHPPHYNTGNIEVIDAIEDWGFGRGFNRGNAIKYIARAGRKEGIPEKEDLKKALWYLKRELARINYGNETDKQPLLKKETVEIQKLNFDPTHLVIETKRLLSKTISFLHTVKLQEGYNLRIELEKLFKEFDELARKEQ